MARRSGIITSTTPSFVECMAPGRRGSGVALEDGILYLSRSDIELTYHELDPIAIIRRLDASFSDLIGNRHPDRASNSQIILVKPFGLAIADIAFARQIYEIACAKNIGLQMPE